jgi:hypothetical protein
MRHLTPLILPYPISIIQTVLYLSGKLHRKSNKVVIPNGERIFFTAVDYCHVVVLYVILKFSD